MAFQSLQRSERLVFGVDTSLRSSGVAMVKQEGSKYIPVFYGNIRNAPTVVMSQALLNIEAKVTELIETWKPTEVAIEGVFYAKNPKTMMILCHARGVVIATCAKFGIPVYEYAPKDVKQAVTGTGCAEKAQVQAMVGKILAISGAIQNDAADALAIAITHLHKNTGIRAIAPKSL